MKLAWHMPTLRRTCCGLSQRALRLANGLRQFGHDVEFYVEAGKSDIAGDVLDGFCVRRISTQRNRLLHWSLQALGRRRAAAALAAQITSDHEVMLTCQPEFASEYVRHRRDTPLIFVCGGTTLLHDEADRARSAVVSWPRRGFFALDRHLKRRNERNAFRLADAVVFDSDATRAHVTRDYRLDIARFQTIHGGVDSDEFQPPSTQQRHNARHRLGIGPSEDVLAWTGRLSPEKNIDFLLNALAYCRRRPHRVLIVGDGPARDALMKLNHRLGLNSVVSFVGIQSDVRPFLHAADVFVFPSRGESFGGALVEAMACGLPCIALRPNGDAIRNASLEIIEPETSGLLVDRAEPAALAAAIELLLVNRELRNALGAAARRRATSLFTWAAAAAQFNALVNEIAARGRPNRRLDAASLTALQPAHA
ncbi:MAG TPA: glycosyltransferase family 4 protein [Phycisphaerae bacterium]|nr:glycosyltransferase family 4 protein [Phycisphaerae bacterium]